MNVRTLSAFILLLALSLITAAVIAYPLWLLVNLVSEQPIHRVFIRAAMIAAIAGFVVVVQTQKLRDPEIRGFGLPTKHFVSELGKGIPIGAALLLPLVILLFALDVRVPTDSAAGSIATSLVIGLLFGLIVAFLEELFCRGALQGALMREHTVLFAVVVQAVFYASLHFIGGDLRIPAEEVTWSSGFRVLADVVPPYAHFMDYLDAFLALVAVGALLGIVRARRGAIAMGIGMHASWIAIIYAIHEHSVLSTDEMSWLASRNYDGVIGWLSMLALLPIVIFAALRWPKINAPVHNVSAPSMVAAKIAAIGALLVAGILAKDMYQGAPVTRGEQASRDN